MRDRYYYVYLDSSYGTELLCKTTDIGIATDVHDKKNVEWKPGYMWQVRITKSEQKETNYFD